MSDDATGPIRFGNPDEYAKTRPTYPDSLFEFLAGLCQRRALACDVGGGSGQATRSLSLRFKKTILLDANPKQVREATSEAASLRMVARAEHLPIRSESVDLLTAAQALHWFSLPEFNFEVKRVLAPKGIIAAWCYGFPKVNERINPILEKLHDDLLSPCWPTQRTLVNQGYGTVPFPFEELSAPEFEMTHQWKLDRFLRYVGTWSACANYREKVGKDPLSLFQEEFEKAWGKADEKRLIRWPLFVRIGRIPFP